MNNKKIKIAVVKVTDENRDAIFRLAMSAYLGEKCKYCLEEFKTLDDLEDAVFAGYHEHGRLAHEKCFIENNPEMIEETK